MKSVVTKEMKLIRSQTKIKCCKVTRISWYHESNKIFFPEKYANFLLLLSYPFRDEKELSSGCPPSCQKKLLEFGVQIVINCNKIKFELCGDLADDSIFRYNANTFSNQDPFGQIKNDKTGETMYSNVRDDENAESNRNYAIPNFMRRRV